MADLFENPMGLCGLNLWNLQVQPQIYLSHYLKKWVLAWLPNIAQKMSYYIAKGN